MYIFAYFKCYECLRCRSSIFYFFWIPYDYVDKIKKRCPVGFAQISEIYQSICYGNILFDNVYVE